MPMLPQAKTGHMDAGPNQLSLNFTSSPHTRESVADKIHAITSGKVTFHVAETEIDEHSFAIKASYMGRSYTIK